MATAEARARQALRALGAIRAHLSEIEGRLGLADGTPPAPPVPVPLSNPEARARKAARDLEQVAARLAAVAAAVARGPADASRAAAALKGDPTPSFSNRPKGR